MLMESDETRSLFAESMRVWNAISAQQKDAAILFVDLAGSTEFKAVHGQYLGLQKTFIHNSLVTEAAANPGEVVKYIGDEVMIVTDAERACRLAIQIQQSFAALNQTHSGDSLFPIRSKIGIHWGPVQYWKYPNHEPLDPQGTTVDTSARIVSLAKPQQILCSQKCSERFGASEIKRSPIVRRYVKGIREPIDIIEILWDDQARGIAQNPLPVNDDPQLRSLVRQAGEQLRAKNNAAALPIFQAALDKSPGDFNANLGLGELLARNLGKIDEGKQYLEKARQTNPVSPRLFLLEGYLKWEEFKAEKDPSCLGEAITLTEECLKLAEINTDYESDRLARGNLAYYLTERGGVEDVDRAILLCDDAYRIYGQLRTRELSSFLDTFAFALITRGKRDDVARARTLLEESIRGDRQNPYPHEHMAELIRKEQDLGITSVSGARY